MAFDVATALPLMKARMNRLEGDTSLDTNTAVWHYQSRDSQAGMPEWLRLQRRERWLCEGRDSA